MGRWQTTESIVKCPTGVMISTLHCGQFHAYLCQTIDIIRAD